MARQEDSSSLSSPPCSKITSHLVTTFPYYKPPNYPCELHLPQCVDRQDDVEPRMSNVSCDKQAASCTHSHFASCHGHDDANNLLPFYTESYSGANDTMPSIVCIDKQEGTLLPTDCLTIATDKRACNGDNVDSAKRDHGGATSVRRRLPVKGAPELNGGERRMPVDRRWAAETSFQLGEAKRKSCAVQQIVGSPHRAQSLPNLCQHQLGNEDAVSSAVDVSSKSHRTNAAALVEQKIQEAQTKQKRRTLNELASSAACDDQSNAVCGSREEGSGGDLSAESYVTHFEQPTCAAAVDWSRLDSFSSLSVEHMDSKVMKHAGTPSLDTLPFQPSKNSLELACQLEHYAALLRANCSEPDAMRRVESQPTLDSPLYNKCCSRRRSPSSNTDSNCSSVTNSEAGGDSFASSQNPVWILRLVGSLLSVGVLPVLVRVSSFRRRKLLEQMKEQRASGDASPEHKCDDQLSLSPTTTGDDGEEMEDETDKLLKGDVASDPPSHSASTRKATPLSAQKRSRKKKESKTCFRCLFAQGPLIVLLCRKIGTPIIHEPAVLIEGVLFRARYLGSTQIVCEGPTTKASRMLQAQEAVSCIKAPNGESQPHVEVDLFISIEKIMVLNTDMQVRDRERRGKNQCALMIALFCFSVPHVAFPRWRACYGAISLYLMFTMWSLRASILCVRVSETDVRQDIMMDHNLRTISYIADIGDLLVLMARRVSQASSSSSDREAIKSAPKMICHVFESEEAQFIAQSIGQAFQVAYMEFLRSHGIEEPRYIKEMDYQEVLNSQEIYCDELEMFSSKEMQKDIVIPKKKDEPLGVVVVESGWGSMLPTVVVANMLPEGPAARCKKINIGDHVIALNGISFVGLPLHICQSHIKVGSVLNNGTSNGERLQAERKDNVYWIIGLDDVRSLTAVKITVVQTPPVVEVRIKRPDTKYQLGFSVQNGVVRSCCLAHKFSGVLSIRVVHIADMQPSQRWYCRTGWNSSWSPDYRNQWAERGGGAARKSGYHVSHCRWRDPNEDNENIDVSTTYWPRDASLPLTTIAYFLRTSTFQLKVFNAITQLITVIFPCNSA
ncbi:LOW QUALITY PROTEIN: hypothetical protein M514_01284, partial [Trichuris suis]